MTGREVAIFGIGLALGGAGGFALHRRDTSPADSRAPSSAERADDDLADPASSTPVTPAKLEDPLANIERIRKALRLREDQLKRREADLGRREAELERRTAELGDDGGASPDAAPPRSRFDVTPQDLAELARKGTVLFCVPSGSDLRKRQGDLGLAPSDLETIEDAYARSRQRLLEALSPFCDELTDGGTPDTEVPLVLCAQSVVNTAQRGGDDAFKAFKDACREAAEIRAGSRPAPDNDGSSAVVRVLTAVSRESDTLVSDLAADLGPDEARRIVYRDHGCGWSGSFGK